MKWLRGLLAGAGALAILACGSRAGLDDPDSVIPGQDGGLDGQPPPPPKTCGDMVCQSTESCTNCPLDCGLCKTCGNGACDNGENCSSCPEDCGKCPACGDGFCNNGEDCLTCAPDCGQCMGCGDKICDKAKNEDCFTCPQDCGMCKGCPNGKCDGNETCSSCPSDCGPCAVCGNNKCENFETCANCPADCGMCQNLSCFAELTCSLKCINLMTMPPSFSASCVATCVAMGCAKAQFFFDQAINCIIQKGLPKCMGGNFGCLQMVCQNEFNACLGSGC